MDVSELDRKIVNDPVERSPGLTEDSIRRIVEIINGMNDSNINVRYQDCYRAGELGRRYRFEVRGKKSWQVDIGTTNHYNYSQENRSTITSIDIVDLSGQKRFFSELNVEKCQIIPS